MIKNIDRVHPIKREKVRKGMEFVEQTNTDGIIKQIILFGSAATDSCTEESDIDLCLVSEGTCADPVFFQIHGGLLLAMDDLCDVLVYRRVQGALKDEIDKKGIVIYEYQ